MNLKQKRRVFYTLILVTMSMFILMCRLAYIQIYMRTMLLPNSKYSLEEKSVIQRERSIMLDSGRGTFRDRNGEPLTDETIPALVLFPTPSHLLENEIMETQIKRISDSLGTTVNSFLQVWSHLEEPSMWRNTTGNGPLVITKSQASVISKMDMSGVMVLPFRNRYSDNYSGMQWLGYLAYTDLKESSTNSKGSPKVGGSGLEKTLEPLIKGIGSTIAYYEVDGKGIPIAKKGISMKAPNNPYYPLRFTTTIDKYLQKKIEQLSIQSGMKQGAVVVLDVNNADILAMMSKPFYHPLDIHPEQEAWNNKAIQSTTPGSIFKTVIVAAALEAGVTSAKEKFMCNGDYGKYGLSCWKEGGHGILSLEQAYAQSCNIVFATLAERLTSNQIEETARALGMGRRVGWEERDILGYPLFKPLDNEEEGRIFNVSSKDGGVRAQTGIGQRDVAMTPLQAANLVVTLLNKGQLLEPRILERISYHNGQVMRIFKPHASERTIHTIQPVTAQLISSWMRTVITEGTGKSLSQAEWPLAGKSGTAQVVWKGSVKNNQWFIGYGPADQPKYAVAVMLQNVTPETNNQATTLFGQIMGVLLSEREFSSGSTGTLISNGDTSNSSFGSRIHFLR